MKRASCQSGDLTAFYGALASSENLISAEIGRAMLALLSGTDDLCARYAMWGLTSHYHLWLLAEYDYATTWYVQVIGWSPRR